jgi:PAS domain S-box-containing protein
MKLSISKEKTSSLNWIIASILIINVLTLIQSILEYSHSFIPIILNISGIILISVWLNISFKNNKTLKNNQLEGENEKLQAQLVEIEQKLKNKELTLSELYLYAIVTKQTENAIMLMNAKGDILWVNDSFSRMYEYTYEEFTQALGHNIRQTSFNPKINERIQRCTIQRESVTYDALNITRTGKEIWTRTSLIPLVDENNDLIGMATIDADIHNRVIAGDEMISHIRSFEQKIENISEQLNLLVELTDALFERIDISQRRIERTDQIIESVKDIADKTKILGINASIEAYSAGEAGKGFRVIANEVVNISKVTHNSLTEINELIGKIQRSSDKMSNMKERSEIAISSHRNLITELKNEINSVTDVLQLMK